MKIDTIKITIEGYRSEVYGRPKRPRAFRFPNSPAVSPVKSPFFNPKPTRSLTRLNSGALSSLEATRQNFLKLL